MKVEQVYELTNTIAQELMGESVIVNEDLSNVVDIGKAFENMGDRYDKYVRSLHDHIGKMWFVNRTYSGGSPNILMDGWEFGSILEKVRADMPQAEENESWELQDRTSYDPNIFYKPAVHAKFFNNRVTFEIPISITEKQVRSAFSNATQLNAFYSMIYNAVDKAMTVRLDSLIDRTINAGIAETMYDAFPAGTYTGTTVRAVNLLKLYNEQFTQTLTFAQAMFSPEFMRYASYVIKNYLAYLKRMSKCFNIKGYPQFTSDPSMILLSQFRNGVETYLESDTFHNQLVAIGKNNVTDVPYFQGSGTDFALGSATKIHVEVPLPTDETQKKEIEASGILGVMFDWKSCMINNNNPRVTSNYNGKAEFTNYWYKEDCSYVTRPSRNFIVFFAA